MLYTISNSFIKVTVASLGATLMGFEFEGKDIVLGFDDEDGYLGNKGPYFGATVGRSANRTAQGKFELNGKEYNLPINNGPNSLHGGIDGLSFVNYELKEIKEDSITLTYKDPDGRNGYPGNLNLEVTYSLKDHTLLYEFKAVCDSDSILNITNHSYFNLDAANNSILDHEFKMHTDKVSLNDNDGLATSKVIDVNNTSFDFRDFKTFKENFNLKHDNLSNGGIDHNFVLEKIGDKTVCELRNNDLMLTVKSDLPDIHVYTANYLDDFKGKANKDYHQYWGVALECQFYPNAINYNDFIKPIIKKDEEVKHYISYTIERR